MYGKKNPLKEGCLLRRSLLMCLHFVGPVHSSAHDCAQWSFAGSVFTNDFTKP